MSVGEERLTTDAEVVLRQVVVGEEGCGGERWTGEMVAPWELLISNWER